MLKRALSLLLAFVMVFSLLPVNALAEETAPDEGESLLLEPAEIAEEEPETIPPSETEEKNIIEETEEAPVPETQAPTVPETAPETVPETVPETQPETVPETEPEQLLEAAGEAESVLAENNSTWILNETKELALSGTNNPFGSDAPNYTFTFTPTENGRYIFYWPSENCHGNGPHVMIRDSDGAQLGSGNVYADFYGDAGNVYTVEVFSCYAGEYTASITLANSTDSGSIYFQETSISGYVGQRSGRRVSRSPDNYAHGLITWESSNENIVKITNPQFSALEFEMVGEGETTITGTDAHGQTATLTVTVKGFDDIASWDLNETKSLQMTPTANNDPCFTFRFHADNAGMYVISWNEEEIRGFDPVVQIYTKDGHQISGGNVFAAFYATGKTDYLIKVLPCSDQPYDAEFTLSPSVDKGEIYFWDDVIEGQVGDVFGNRISRQPANYIHGDITWVSSNENIVKITNSQFSALEFEMVGPGEATITATDAHGQSASFTVIVADIDAVDIQLDTTVTGTIPAESSVYYRFTAPETGKYIIQLDYQDGYVPITTVECGGIRIAGDGSDRVQFSAEAGKEYIIAMENWRGTEMGLSFRLMQAVPVQSIELGYYPLTNGFVGEELGFSVTVSPENADIESLTWESSDESVVSIGERYGLYQSVNLVGPGTATVTVSAPGCTPLKITYTVSAVSGSIALNGTFTAGLQRDEKTAFYFTPDTDGNYTVYETGGMDSYIEVYEISEIGNRHNGSGNGSATFWANAGDKCLIVGQACQYEPYEYTYCVAEAVEPTGISLSPASYTGYVGETFYPDVKAEPANAIDPEVQWSSSNPDVASVTGGGRVQLRKAGTATITAATSGDNPLTATCTVTVKAPVALTVGSTKTVTLPAGSSVGYQFTAPGNYSYTFWDQNNFDGISLTVSDSNGEWITGGSIGKFTAVKGETYLICVTNVSTKSKTCKFIIKQDVNATSIFLPYTSEIAAVGDEFELWVGIEPINAIGEEITFTLDNDCAEILEQQPYGYIRVKMNKVGTVKLTATSETTNLTASCTFTVLEASTWELGEDKDVSFTAGESQIYQFTAPETGKYVIWNESDYWPGMQVRAPGGDQMDENWGRSVNFYAEEGQTYLIKLDPNSGDDYDITFHLGKSRPVTGISFPWLEPLECNINDIFEGDLIFDPLDHTYANIEWTYDAGLDLLEFGSSYFKVKAIKEGTHTLTATVLDEYDEPTDISASVTFEIGPKPAAFADGKRVVQAHWIQPYSFTAPASGDYTMWTNSDEWVVFEIVDLVENRSIGYGDNLLHCSLQKGRNYTVYVVNRNDYQITVDAFLRKDVAPTGIRISGDTEQRFVGENVYLYADGEPTNSTLNSVQWEIIAGNADIESNGTECVITPKDAGNITVKATSGNVSGECTFTVRESNIWNLDSSKSLTMNGWEPVVYQFTAPADSGYIVWEDNSDRTWIEVCNQQGEYLGMSGGGFCQFDAKEGQTYRIKLCANSDEAYEAAFHLETLTEPTGIKPLYGSDITAYVGDEIFLPLAFTPGNAARGQISWASSNTDVVEVVEDEYVNGYGCFIRLNAPGDATITATHQRVDGVSTKFHIKVLDVDTIALDSTVSVTLEGHESTAAYDFTAPSSGTYVIYDETNQYGSVEVVSGDEYFWGDNRVQFTAQKGQTYRVVFHHWDDRNEKGEVTYSYVLTKAVPATGIRLSEEHLSGLPGDTRYLNVLGEPVNADLSGLTWSIDNKAVAVLVGENATNREIQLVGQGTATVTVRLGDLEVNCPITVGAEREAISVGDSKTVHLKHMETVGFAFTPDLDGDYYFYEASRDWVTIVVWSEDGSWVDGTSDGRVRILDAKAGTTYYITVTNDMYGVAGVAKDFTLHLEEAVKATGISLSKTGIDTRYVYPGTRLWVIAYTNPLNGYQGRLEWSVSEEYENCVTFVEEEYDPRGDGLCLEIHDNAPAGTMVVTCTDTETGLSATLNIVIKSIKSILLGKNYSVTQRDQENDLATFTPEEDGTYILKASTDVIVWVYTDDEDIHTPDGPETEMLLELKAGVTYNVESVLLGEDGNMTAGDYDLRIIKNGVNPLSFTSDHISIEQNTTKSLGLSVQPAALSDLVTYKSSDETIVTVDENGEITTSETPGSAYITATLTFGSRTFTARCRVDVIAKDSIDGVQLSTTAPVVELYSTNYSTITAIPYKQTGSGRSVVRESLTIPVVSAQFVDTPKLSPADLEILNTCFKLDVLDSRTLQIAPDADMATAVFNKTEGAPSLKSSYTANLELTFGDGTTQIVPIKLTIKKTVPTLKTSKLAFNSFITGDTRSIVLTGGIVTGISENTDMAKSSVLHKWLELDDTNNTLKLDYKEGYQKAKKYSGNVYLYVDVAGWSVPAKVTVPVSVAYTAPSLKLSATSVTVSSSNSKGIDLKLLCGKKGQTLDQLEVNGISVDESEVEFIRENFDLETGSFTLLPTDQYAQKTKSVTLWVSFTNTSESYPLTVKVTPKAATLAAKPASVKLNAYRGDSAVIPLTPTPADYTLESLEDLGLTLYKVVNRQNEETDELDVDFYDGALHVSTTDGTALGTTYKLVINAKGNELKKTTITLTTLTEKQSVITASAKITGSVDLTFPASYAVIQPTFTNYTNGDYALIDFEITNSKGVVQEGYERFFRLENMDGQYRLSVANPEDQPAPGTYYLRPILLLGDGKSPDKTGVVKFTVKRTAVSLKASATKIILNKDIGDWATVDISCLTKGYDFVEPEVIKYSSGLDVVFLNGMLIIRTGAAAYGKTHTITLQARDVKEDKEIKVSVVIPKQGSKVDATLKAKGTIDLVRDTTSVVITPFYTNYSGQGDLTPVLTIQKYEVGDKKYMNGEDVTDEEFYIDNNDDGTFTVTRAPGANIDLKQYKYRAEMTFTGPGIDNLLTIPAVALPLKSNTVKATVSGTPVLYKADKYSRASFRLNIADATVNAIEAVESTNPLYQIEDYGNGEYAICFNTSSWTAATKYPTSVTLNVFLDGNENAATKVTLKLSLK